MPISPIDPAAQAAVSGQFAQPGRGQSFGEILDAIVATKANAQEQALGVFEAITRGNPALAALIAAQPGFTAAATRRPSLRRADEPATDIAGFVERGTQAFAKQPTTGVKPDELRQSDKVARDMLRSAAQNRIPVPDPRRFVEGWRTAFAEGRNPTPEELGLAPEAYVKVLASPEATAVGSENDLVRAFLETVPEGADRVKAEAAFRQQLRGVTPEVLRSLQIQSLQLTTLLKELRKRREIENLDRLLKGEPPTPAELDKAREQIEKGTTELQALESALAVWDKAAAGDRAARGLIIRALAPVAASNFIVRSIITAIGSGQPITPTMRDALDQQILDLSTSLTINRNILEGRRRPVPTSPEDKAAASEAALDRQAKELERHIREFFSEEEE